MPSTNNHAPFLGQVIVIATTNRLESIDPALRRPGRFDRELYFPLPNIKVSLPLRCDAVTSDPACPPSGQGRYPQVVDQ